MPITTIKTSDGGGFDTYGRYSNITERGSETTAVHNNQFTYQPVIKFDVSGLAGQSVISVTFKAYMETSSGSSKGVRLDQINDSYYNTYGEYGIYNWSDHAPTVNQIGQVDVGTAAGWKEWDSDAFPGLIAAVQNWIDENVSNNGFLLATTSQNDGYARYFRTKEYSDGSSAAQLIIEHITYNETARLQLIAVTSGETINVQTHVEVGKSQDILAVMGEADAYYANELGRATTILSSMGEVDAYYANETGKTVTVLASIGETDVQAMIETGKAVTALSTQGEADAYYANETGRAVTALSTQGEADAYYANELGRAVTVLSSQGESDNQAMIETGKLQSIPTLTGGTDVQTMVETGALLLMKAWIVSRFPWAFSEVDLKTATFSERRNINT